MFQIRAGTYETNSSSAHSLIIKKDGIRITSENFDTEGCTYINRNGELRYWNHDLVFDRSPFQVLTSVGDKLAYVTAAFESQRDRIIAEVMKRIPSIEKIKFPKDWETDEPVYGWIDHQSIGMLPYAVRKEGIDPVDVILNTRYIIIVDGDEYGIFDNMVQNGLINMDEIEKTYDYFTGYRDAHPEIYDTSDMEELEEDPE